MNRGTFIVLCSTLLILLGIVAVGVYYLYHDVTPADSLAAVYADNPAVEEEETQPVQEAEPEYTDAEVLTIPENVPAEIPAEPSIESDVRKVDIAKGPFKVANSAAPGKDYLIRQNKDNSIELLDEKGNRKWRFQLSDKIGGMVGQVDYYHNGKIQYLIVEGKNVHLIDRLGREVSSFPRTLPAKAIVGPDRVDVRGTNYWRVDTEKGTVFLNLKKNIILDKLPD